MREFGSNFDFQPKEDKTAKVDVLRFVNEPAKIPDGVSARRDAISLLPVERAEIQLDDNVENKASSCRIEVRGVPVQTTMNDSVIVCGKLLGEGAFGEVFAVHAEIADRELKELLKSASGHEIESCDISEEPCWKRYVLKVLAGSASDMSDEEWRKQIENELVGHDAAGILVSAKIFESREGRRAYALLLDRAPGETLRIVSVASEEKKKSAQFQVTLAVAMRAIASRIANFHKMGWTHRDIKPGNLMVDLVVPTLSRPIDFGTAEGEGLKRVTTDEEKKGAIGTFSYMTPEAMLEEDENLNERDIYALALSFGEALGLMRISRKNNDGSIMTPHQVAFASATGRFVESRRPEEDMIGVDALSKYANVDRATKSVAHKELFKLLYDIVRPHDSMEDRQAKWARWNNGKGISMDAVVKRIDGIIQMFIEEVGDEEAPVTQNEIDAMEEEVRNEFEEKKKQVYAKRRILNRDDENNIWMEQVNNAVDAMNEAKDTLSGVVLADEALSLLNRAEKEGRQKMQQEKKAA